MEKVAWDWLTLTKTERQQAIADLLADRSSTDYIRLVGAGNLGIYASLGGQFDYAIFGRDSIQVAEDLLATHQPLARQIIHTLASLQGVKSNAHNEEEPGKIHHEYRALTMHGSNIPDQSIAILRRLQHKWGTDDTDNMRYYGSYDTTPLFIRLVGRYVHHHGQKILNETYHGLDGQKVISDSLRSAVEWLVDKLDGSNEGLLAYLRINKEYGLRNQAWKDSGTSYLHGDGSLPNFEAPIASIELQGYAYDALQTALLLVPADDATKDHWRRLAARLQTGVISLFWIPEQQYFAQAVDYREDGQLRQVNTITSNPGLLLDSTLLDNLPEDKQSYIDTTANMLMSNELLTPAGIRCRALRHKQIPGFVDYHGSYTVWPKETYAIARGLRSHGKSDMASRLEACLLDSVQRAGEFYEFFYVDEQEKAYYDQTEALEHFKTISLDKNLAVAEPGQAWTISAVLAILHNRHTV